MNNAKRVTTNLRNSVFLILLSFILFLTVQSSESKQYLANTEEVSQPSLSENNENNDWVLIPGTTKLLQVQFQGNTEDIFFEFSASEDKSSTFKISTIINGKAIHTENKEFLQEETLIANIDYQNKEVSVIGDHGFSISHSIQEDFYQIVVFQKRVLDLDQELSLTGSKNSRKYKVILGTVGGTCGLAGVLIIFGLVWKKRKTAVKGETPQCSEIGKFNVKALQSTVANKDCELQHAKSDFEVGSKLILDDNFKKASPSTQTASTLATLAKLETQGFNTDKSFLSSNSKDCDLESIPEIDNDQKHSPYVSLPKKETPQNAKQNAKFPPKRKSQSIIETEIALDLELDLDNGGRRMPTVVEIKALVRKMEEEGEIPCECDPSEDTDEEDQYEAPALPNYFCCMICYEGRRCTIVEPCRHVFACHDCVKELLDTYKICILCTRAIDSYESM